MAHNHNGAVIQGQCECGNSQPSKFWYLRNDYELLGVCCKRRSCGKEYLVGRFTAWTGTFIFVNNLQMFYKPPSNVEMDPEFQVRVSHERVRDIGNLRPGDHVGLDRWYLIWHHAIVVEVNANPFRLVIMGWHGSPTNPRRVRKEVSPNELDHLYKFNYSEAIEWENPPELVIARANSRLHHQDDESGLPRPWVLEEYEEHYGIFNANCEHFSTYCKTGIPTCNQSAWLLGKLKEGFMAMIGRIWKTVLAAVAVEVLENVIQGALSLAHNVLFEAVGLVGILTVELVSFKAAQNRLRERLANGEIDQEQYRIQLGKRVIEFLLVILVAGGGGVVVAIVGTPLAEIIFAPILFIAAKASARILTHFMDDEWIKWFADKWQQLANFLHDIKEAIVAAAQKVVNFVQTEVIPRISAVVESIRDLFTWWLV